MGKDIENPMVVDCLWDDEAETIEEQERKRWDAYYEYYEE